jgi:hypothetical protein
MKTMYMIGLCSLLCVGVRTREVPKPMSEFVLRVP